jgi:hypothetical protein
MCSCWWSRSWLCSGMHTSLLRKREDARPNGKNFDARGSYAVMTNREGAVIGVVGRVICVVGRASFALGTTLF